MRTLSKRLSLSLTFAIIAITSCTGLLPETTSAKVNDNAKFYGTEWSTDDMKEGLKFYNDNTVMYFSGPYRGTGTFKYYPNITDYGYIEFNDLEVFFSSFTAVEDCAYMKEDGSMKLCWHAMGEDKGYYEILYKRR